MVANAVPGACNAGVEVVGQLDMGDADGRQNGVFCESDRWFRSVEGTGGTVQYE